MTFTRPFHFDPLYAFIYHMHKPNQTGITNKNKMNSNNHLIEMENRHDNAKVPVKCLDGEFSFWFVIIYHPNDVDIRI